MLQKGMFMMEEGRFMLEGFHDGGGRFILEGGEVHGGKVHDGGRDPPRIALLAAGNAPVIYRFINKFCCCCCCLVNGWLRLSRGWSYVE